MHQRLGWQAPLSLALIAGVSLCSIAVAKPPPPPPEPGVETYLIRQDSSDCNNSNVNANDPSLIGGTVYVLRQSSGATTAKVAITATPNTAYNLYHKCVGQIGTVTTSDEGIGEATFQFQANPGIITFDMYPNGAPAGNKFQSVPINVP